MILNKFKPAQEFEVIFDIFYHSFPPLFLGLICLKRTIEKLNPLLIADFILKHNKVLFWFETWYRLEVLLILVRN